jgi:ankyrin repeat protein
MKTNLLISGILLGAVTFISAATNDLTTAIQRGLFEEEANQNLGAAIQAYQSVASQFDKDRKLAATAIFRLGECYRKQGNTNDAATQYQRILRDFSDQPTLVTLSRQNLAGMGSALQATGQAATKQYTVVSGDTLSSIVGVLGVSGQALMDANPGLYSAGLRVGQVLRIPTGPESSTSSSGAPVMSDAARQEQKRLLEEEMKLVQKQMEALQQQRDANGAISPGDPLPLQRQMLELKRQVAALDAGLPISFAASGPTAPATSTEADEVRRIQALIKDSPDLINAPDKNGETLLQSAAANGNLAVAKLLLDSGAAVDGLQQPGLTALHYAAANGHKAVVDLLLSRGAKADAQFEAEVTPLHLAALKGYEAVAKSLLAAGAPVDAQTKGDARRGREDLQYYIGSGQTPLHLAAVHGYGSLAQLLLAKGANVNSKDGSGLTALHRAVAGGYTGLVETLLAKGANANAEDESGRTPLSYAVPGHYEPVMKLLLAAHANPNAGRLNVPLAVAAYYGDMPSLKLLLANGADPNTNSLVNWTVSVKVGNVGNSSPFVGPFAPLFLAVNQRHADAVAELLRARADFNLPAPNGAPLTAYALGDIPTLKALLEGGADANVRIPGGTPLLLQAVLEKNQPAVELLLAHKADVNAEGPAFNNEAQSAIWTPLHAAATYGPKAIAELLLKAGADVNARDKVGDTPLHLAVVNGQRELAELLLANKADPNARDNKGQTPLDFAKSQAQANLPRPAMPLPGMPMRPLTRPSPVGPAEASASMNITFEQPGAPTTATQQESKPETMADLLRRNGALDDLPQLDQIGVRRGGMRINTPFGKGARDWSQFTLLELLAVECDFLAGSPSGDRSGGFGSSGFSASAFFSHFKLLPFPDLAHLHIRRPAADLKSWKEQVLDLRPVLEAGDCSKDVRLEWGDVVEIPEADHPLNEKWPGFSRTELANLQKCLTRQVQIVISGQVTNITVAPKISGLDATPPNEPIIDARTSFWLKPVLLQSKLVLTSSDLSRVKVTRRDPTTGQEHRWVVDCSETSPATDLWLRDGDKIEVPEKTNASAAAQAPGPQSPPK